jgi:hypothetical protein
MELESNTSISTTPPPPQYAKLGWCAAKTLRQYLVFRECRNVAQHCYKRIPAGAKESLNKQRSKQTRNVRYVNVFVRLFNDFSFNARHEMEVQDRPYVVTENKKY